MTLAQFRGAHTDGRTDKLKTLSQSSRSDIHLLHSHSCSVQNTRVQPWNIARSGAIGKASDLRFTGHGFESWLAGHHCIMALSKLLTSVRLCHQAVQFGTSQGVIALAGKVTAGLVESNSSLPPGLWLMSPLSPAGWLPRNRDQLRTQRTKSSMGLFYFFTSIYH